MKIFPMIEKTLIILKPDAVSRGLIGEVISRLEKTGLQLSGCKMQHLSTEILKEHYSHLVDKPFFPDILKYMQASPVMLQVWTGDNAAVIIRKLVGVTNPAEALPGTIRGDFALNIARNIIHASEDSDAAKTEVARFFADNELFSYERCDHTMLYELDR